MGIVADLKEHLLKRRDRDAIILYFETEEVIVKLTKEVFKFVGELARNLNCHLTLDLRQLHDFRAQFFMKVGHNLFVSFR